MEPSADAYAALRRVADLVTSRGAPDRVQGATVDEISALVDSRVGPVPHTISIFRRDAAGAMTLTAAAGDSPVWPVGARLRLEGRNVLTLVSEARQPVRLDVDQDATGEWGDCLRARGLVSGVAASIAVGGRSWGVLCVLATRSDDLGGGTETQLVHFADLVASAIAIAETRAEADRLADEQASLRRVATFAAGPNTSKEILTAIATEVGVLLEVDCTVVYRYRGAQHAELMATWGEPDLTSMLGLRTPLDIESVGSRIWRTRGPVRLDDAPILDGPVIEKAREVGIFSSVGCPVVIDGQLWGGLVVHSTAAETLPAATEARLGAFTELIVTTVVRVDARGQVDRFADEQAALRRVATLVAQEAPPATLFATVAEELATLLEVDCAALLRYEDDDCATMLAGWGIPDLGSLVDRRVHLGEHNAPAASLAGGRPARMIDTALATGELSACMRERGIVSTVAGPVLVEGRVWGCLMISSLGINPLPADSEPRIEGFAQLVAAAIANAENRAKLTASRARVIRTADETRRRLQRDLHDGAQQRLVHALIVLKLAQAAASDGQDTSPLIDEALLHAQRAASELRDLVRGIMPASLTRGGLGPGLQSLVEDLALPVHVDVSVSRLPEQLETTAYFIVAEAVTNVVKHAAATKATVTVALDGAALTVTVEDDGRGGADETAGTGLAGLADRVNAVEGELKVVSRPGEGTALRVRLPIP